MLMRMEDNGNTGEKAVELLQELYQMYDGRSDLPRMVYRGYERWQVWTSSQATHRLCRGLSVVIETWKRKGKVG